MYAPDHCNTILCRAGCQANRKKLELARKEILRLQPPPRLEGFVFMGGFEEFYGQRPPEIVVGGSEGKRLVEVFVYTEVSNRFVSPVLETDDQALRTTPALSLCHWCARSTIQVSGFPSASLSSNRCSKMNIPTTTPLSNHSVAASYRQRPTFPG